MRRPGCLEKVSERRRKAALRAAWDFSTAAWDRVSSKVCFRLRRSARVEAAETRSAKEGRRCRKRLIFLSMDASCPTGVSIKRSTCIMHRTATPSLLRVLGEQPDPVILQGSAECAVSVRKELMASQHVEMLAEFGVAWAAIREAEICSGKSSVSLK